MPFTIHDNLTEEFDLHSGAMIGYMDKDGNGIDPRYHYDLRAFHSDDITVPRTMLDFNYWNNTYFNGMQMAELDSPRIVTGRSIAARYLSDIDGLLQGELDLNLMSDLDLSTLNAGNENWPISDPDVVFGKDSTERYATSLRITLTGGVEKIVTSNFRDNILADLNDSGHQYYLEFALPGFPAQAAGSHLNLDLSRVEFSNNSGFSGAETDSFRFGDSLHSLTAGGDTYFRINRDQFVSVDLTAVTYIRFKLTSVNNFTLKIQAMRIVRDDYTWDTIDTESKRSVLARSVPRDSGTEPTTVTTGANGPILAIGTRPKNVQLMARFNTGHSPAGNDNILRLYGRYDTDQNDAVFVELKVRNTQSVLRLYQKIGGVDTLIVATALLTHILVEERDYVLLLELEEGQARATIYNAAGAFLGSVVYTTDWQDITLTERGYTGFYFYPYNYDFTVSYMQNHGPDFARFESTPFPSHTPIVGATISAQTSSPFDLAVNSFVPAGDATVTLDSNFGTPAPSQKFVRDGTDWQGGYQTDYIYIGNTQYLTIEGDIYPIVSTGQTGLRGQWRVVLLDKYDSVGYIGRIRGLLPNQWNHFKIHVNDEHIIPALYRVIIQQIGFFNDVFWIDRLAVNHQTVTWEISPNGGDSWYKFLQAQNEQYSAVNFKEAPGTSLKVRAIGLSDLSWISGYELIPIYGLPGQFTEPPAVPVATNDSRDVRIFGTGSTTLVTRDVRITGTQSTNTTRDIRITGVAGSNTTRDVRITGETTTAGLALPLLFNP